MPLTYPDSIHIVDGHYVEPKRAGGYLIVDQNQGAFIDSITRFSVPHFMEGLSAQKLAPEDIRYIVITHVHLDHSGGTAELAKHCPKATVICHPRAERHLVDPERLLNSAKRVYGEEQFRKLYGEIEPVPQDRVQVVEDNEVIALGNRELRFLDSPGHARHHHAVHDLGTNSMFTGDVFGSHYPTLQGGNKPYFSYVCAAPEFDPEAAKASIQRVVDSGADRVFVTHFGGSEALEAGAELLCRSLDAFDDLAQRASESDLEGEDLQAYCHEACLEIFRAELKNCGLDADDTTVHEWATKEHAITSGGVAVLAERRRKAAAEQA